MKIKNKKLKCICVIPARAGSKGIKNKNIKKLHKKPLFIYSLEKAIKSKIFDHVIVSSDHEKILQICKTYKNVISLKRPRKYSTDHSKTESALIHACQYVQKKINYKPDVIFTLEPTSPLRSKKNIIDAYNALSTNSFDSVISVSSSKKSIGVIKNKRFIFSSKERLNKSRRQDRKPIYFECGTLYATRYDVLINKNSVLGNHIYPLVVSREESLDINEPFDFLMIEKILKMKKKHD
jgi:CMP-N,N'-diacetyllegionaminic acid synthase